MPVARARRLRPRGKPFDHPRALRRRAQSGEPTDRHGHGADARRRRQRAWSIALCRQDDRAVQQRTGARHAAHIIHGPAAEVPDPHGNGKPAGRPHRPVIGEMAARPGLHSHREGKVERRAEPESRNARDGIAQDVEHEGCGGSRHDAAAGRRVGAHSTRHGPPRIRPPHSAVCEHAVGVRELEQCHISVSKSQAETVVVGGTIERREPRDLEGPQQARDSNPVGELDRGHVVRARQRLAGAHGSVKGAVVVARAVGSGRCLVGVWDVGEDRGRRVAPIERERVEERLERGSRLSRRDDHVHLTRAVRPEIGRADPREYLARAVVENDDGRLLYTAFAHDLHRVAHFRLEPGLEGEIERGAPQAVDRLPSLVAPSEQAAREMRCEERRRGPLGKERLGGCACQFGVGSVARVPHADERLGAPRLRPPGRYEWVGSGRSAGQPGEQRGLREAQLGGGCVEIETRAGGDPDRALAEGDAVQVLLEDRLLGEVTLQPERPQDLQQLGAPRAAPGPAGPPGRGPEQPGQLHRDRRGAGHDVAGAQVVPRRSNGGAPVHRAMLIEAAVLEREERLQDLRIHFRQREPACQAAVRRVRGPERQPVAVGKREARCRQRRDETGRERPNGPGTQRERQGDGQAPAEREQPAAPVAHRDFTVTVNTPPSLRPWTAGLYISSACAGGRTNTPGVVARAT